MSTIVLVVHLLIAVALVGVVLLQRSEGGGLGIGGGGGGGGGGGMGGLIGNRATANLLTRATAVLAACFFGTSVLLAILAGNTGEPRSIVDEAPVAGEPAVPLDTGPSVPTSE